jgi:spoIIIJ-associated protein
VEWVETTGRTIEEAKDAALDELGVDEADAEFEVLEEPKSGLFGRLRAEARVRARVRPTAPRPKAERRDRRRRAGAKADAGSAADEGTDGSTADGAALVDVADAPAGGRGGRRGARRRGEGTAGQRPGGRRVATVDDEVTAPPSDEEKEPAMDAPGMTLAEQGEVASEFLEGLLDAFGLDGTVSVEEVDEDTVEVAVHGADLGLLIGPRGQTLTAVQELARTVVQRQQAAPPAGRLRIDVSGYRQRRRDALERFTRDVAAQVRESGVGKALEPMSAADRKVVHDTVNTIDGVSTRSEGEEPRRRVVIVPDGDA